MSDLPLVRLIVELAPDTYERLLAETADLGEATLPFDVHVSVLEVRQADGLLVTEFDVICPTPIWGVRNLRLYVRPPSPPPEED